MATSRTVAEFAAKIQQTAKALEQAQLVAVKKAALLTKRRVEAERNSVASGRLRNVGKRGAAISVGYTVDAGANPSATIRARGPWPIIESDIGGHTIGGKAKRGGPKRLQLPDGGIRATVAHPGTKGKHPFRKGIDGSLQPVTDLMRTASIDAVKGVFT